MFVRLWIISTELYIRRNCECGIFKLDSGVKSSWTYKSDSGWIELNWKAFEEQWILMKVFIQFQVFVCVLVCVAYASAGFLGGGGGGGGGGWSGGNF